MPRSALGQRIREARLTLGLTQRELAAPNHTKAYVSLIENGHAQPSLPSLIELAARLRRPLSYFLEAADSARSLKAIASLESQGRADLARRRYEAALRAFAEVRALAAAGGDRPTEMRATWGMGEALRELQRHEEAREAFGCALELSPSVQDDGVRCRVLYGLARVDLRTGRFEQAAVGFRAALALAAADRSDPSLSGEIRACLGTALFSMGRLDESWEVLSEARRILEEASRSDRVGEVLMGLGAVLRRSGDFDGAILHYERALALCEQHEDLQTLARVRCNLGMALFDGGRYPDALEHFEASLAMARRLPDPRGECRVLTETARCHLALGDAGRAREVARLARTRSREVGVPDEEARANLVLGALATRSGETQQAFEHLTAALLQCERSSMIGDLATAALQLGHLMLTQQMFKEAMAYFRKAAEALEAALPRGLIMSDLIRLSARSGVPKN